MFSLSCKTNQRTWGGVVYQVTKDLLDGNTLCVPVSAYKTVEGLSIENAGVTPDIEVELLPHESIAGRDAQLEAAIDECLRRLAS